LSVANSSTWAKLNDTLSKKPDYRLLSFLTCCLRERFNILDALQTVFNRFTLDEKQEIAIIRSYINTFYSIITKFINFHPHELLKNLPKIKPK